MLTRNQQHRASVQLVFLKPISVVWQLFLLYCCCNINDAFALSFMVTQHPTKTFSTTMFGIAPFQQQQRRQQHCKSEDRFKNCMGFHLYRRSSPLTSTQSNSESDNESEPFSSNISNEQAVSLSNEEIGRYSRHLVLSNVGMVGQLTLKQSAVLVIGAGGLGSPVLLYLAAAGVGHIGIVDGDTVDVSNLQRQIIHNIHTVHTSKCQSAQQSILQLNPNVNVRIYEEEFTGQTAPRIISDGFAPNVPWTIVIDGSDNFPTKYLIKCVPVSFSCTMHK
jgi:ThiF family